ncbi:MAG: hypothetical protein ACYDAY_08155 [Candidatus Dormibacteria bacterium]
MRHRFPVQLVGGFIATAALMLSSAPALAAGPGSQELCLLAVCVGQPQAGIASAALPQVPCPGLCLGNPATTGTPPPATPSPTPTPVGVVGTLVGVVGTVVGVVTPIVSQEPTPPPVHVAPVTAPITRTPIRASSSPAALTAPPAPRGAVKAAVAAGSPAGGPALLTSASVVPLAQHFPIGGWLSSAPFAFPHSGIAADFWWYLVAAAIFLVVLELNLIDRDRRQAERDFGPRT